VLPLAHHLLSVDALRVRVAYAWQVTGKRDVIREPETLHSVSQRRRQDRAAGLGDVRQHCVRHGDWRRPS